MAEIRAFRAYRYDLGRVGALSDVVAPPYDVIDPGLQQALYDRSPYNVIRLILNKEEPGDDDRRQPLHPRRRLPPRLARRRRARPGFRPIAVRLLIRNSRSRARRYTRRGFLARVRLEPFGAGRIYPHEETLSGPKADRLKLFHATDMNLSPVFGLYPDPDDAVVERLDEAVGRALPLQATDHLGVVSRLWPVIDQHGDQRRRRGCWAQAGLHRRRPSSLRDRPALSRRAAAGSRRRRSRRPNFILMMLVSMSDPGLVILPTHRLVSGLPALTADQLASILGKHFQVEKVGEGEKGRATPGS